jgi:hypothetical protein
MNRAVPWILVAIPAAVFLLFLPAKFSGAPETQHIFSTVGAWLGSIGLGALSGSFSEYGGYLVGAAELVAAVLLLVPATRLPGAALGTAILTGALFFHLFTPLGVAVKFPGEAAGDPTLFVLAVVSWLACLATLYRERPARLVPA